MKLNKDQRVDIYYIVKRCHAARVREAIASYTALAQEAAATGHYEGAELLLDVAATYDMAAEDLAQLGVPQAFVAREVADNQAA